MVNFAFRFFRTSPLGTTVGGASRESLRFHMESPNRGSRSSLFTFLALIFVSGLLAGCGATYNVKGSTGSGGSGGSSSSSTGTIAASPDSVDFGTVSVGNSGNTKVVVTNQGKEAVEVSQLSVSGENFSIDGQGDLPVTLASGSTLSFKVHFKPQGDGSSTGTVSIASNSTITPTASVKLRGTGKKQQTAATATDSLTCTNSSITGAGTDTCTVSLSAAAGSGGTNVNLTSSSGDVTLPATVTIPANSKSASFSASVLAVSAAEDVTLTATENGSSATFSLNLNAYVPTLSLSSKSLNFGSQALNEASQQSVTLTSSGTAPLTVSAASVSGKGFAISGLAVPVTLKPNQSAKVTVQFDPTVTGSASGQLSIASNSSSSPTSMVNLSGTGTSTASSPLNAIACTQSSFTGAGTDSCTVSLSTAATSGGLSVSLSSSDSAVSLPSSVTIPANATSVGFTATVSAVTSSQTATLAASNGGVTRNFALQLNATTPTLALSANSVSFGNVTVGQTVKQSITLSSTGNGPVSISALSVAGSLFSATGLSVPATLNPGQSATLTLQFYAPGTNQYTGVLTIYSNSSTGNMTVNMSAQGTTAPGALSALTCATGSMSAAGTDACNVTLSGPAGSSGMVVNLASNNTAVTVPASVTVPANATSASFNATVASVSSTQTATVSASSGSVTESFMIQLNAGGTSTLSLNSTSISFGTLVINTPATQILTLSSTGTSPVTVNSASVTGPGFSISGVTFPVTLNPGQSANLSVVFDPSSSGAASGQLTIVSTSSTNPNAVVTLGGTGQPHEVNLTWTASSGGSDPNPVAGYNVYRSPDGGATYAQVGSTSASQTSFMDSTVASGQAYEYEVKAFDSVGNESPSSNTTSVTVP